MNSCWLPLNEERSFGGLDCGKILISVCDHVEFKGFITKTWNDSSRLDIILSAGSE